AAHAIADEAAAAAADLISLVDLVVAAGEPEEPLAAEFRSRVLDLLDEVPWIPVESTTTDDRATATPSDTFVWGSRFTRLLAKVFPAAYVRRRVGLSFPDERLSDASLALVERRCPTATEYHWEVTQALCCPGDQPMWESDEADRRFRALLD